MSRSSNIETIDNYRGIDRLSYSSLSTYLDNRLGFYMEYILKDPEYLKNKEENKEDSYALKMGNLIDCLATDPDNYDHIYHEALEVAAPSPQMLKFCELIFNERNSGLDFLDYAKVAYDKLAEWNKPKKLQSGFEAMMVKFQKEGQAYYDELIKAGNKIVITAKEHSIASKQLEKSQFMEGFRDKGDVHTKVVVLFDYDDIPMKCEIDKITIDHENKVVHLIDYKTSWDLENFVWVGFLKRKYYIQASLYKYALQIWTNEHYPGYKVENMIFRVYDNTSKNLTPLVFKTSDAWFDRGFDGFYVGKKYYKGINQIMKEIEFAKKIGDWSISVENHKNNGIIWIPEFNESNE